MEGRPLGTSFPLPSCLKKTAHHSGEQCHCQACRRGDGSYWYICLMSSDFGSSDTAFKRFEGHAEEYFRARKCAGIRWLKPLISNKYNMMLHVYRSCFTLITWLKSTDCLWIFMSIRSGESKRKKKCFFFFSLGMLTQFVCFFGMLKQIKKMNRNVKTLE